MILDAPALDISTARFGDDRFVADDEAMIEVRHAAQWFGVYRAFEVSIDDYVAGYVPRKTPGRFRVSPGRHTLAARMDWVRTQAVTIDLDANDRVVFVCGMDRFHSRVWNVAMIMLGVLLAVTGISICVGWAFPWLTFSLMVIFGFPCLMVMGVCELIVFSRMRPSSPPGSLFRLVRHADEAMEDECA